MPVPKGSTKARRPTLLKVLSGTINTSRENPDEPVAESGAPEMPVYFTAVEIAAWKRLCEDLERIGVLAKADGIALELTACALATVMQARQELRDQPDQRTTCFQTTKDGETIEKLKPQYQLIKEQGARCEALLGKFGLSPADRARVVSGKPNGTQAKPEDEFG